MTETLAVAPREIHDLVYRCGRIAGIDAGTADRLARNVTFAEMHYQRAVVALAAALTQTGPATVAAMASAPDAILSAEIDALRRGGVTARFDPPVPLAAVAASLSEAARRGSVTVDLPATIDGSAALDSVRLEPGSGRPDDLGPAFDERATAAYRQGVVVERAGFELLEAAAGGFLVEEAVLDSIEA